MSNLPTPGPSEWERLVAQYHAAVTARVAVTPPVELVDAGDEAEAAFEAALSVVSDRLTEVCEFPAPTFAALAEKCELISAMYPSDDHLDGQDAAYIIADVRRLAARGEA
jgi:hypothetical protein